ncbi:hypothetical protein C8F04DRAFT_1048530 [Mycena alexandri]|uniref:CCZ1/INTU/HSP4 first Longin domain-containing protein n=1 Tax=Mycena alexandri TaxID=1745969 RepID=A0AAD6WS07_9AGAR|nr:hypothetical protein C8F04DRAFT_1048530 [Mycena alexandri]
MSRIAPNLLYLTIYNPTLRPSGPVAPDDEDAEEQAHILFYTSKERAVSRDRMLRQVGLAKALTSFSEMFNADDPCNNVHSQTKRMVMVSPEPDFWIHSGIEVAKTPRPPSADKAKGKGKDKAKAEQPLLYDYHEHSVHDIAVQEDMLRGYDTFKLRHGSFASILSSLGQEALELQLERFFTVWAWSWNLEDGPEFGDQLGPPIHPLHSALLPALDAFSARLPDEVVAIAVSPPYVIPSTRYTAAAYPPALPFFLLALLPPPQPQPLAAPPPAAADRTLRVAAHKAPPPAWPPAALPPAGTPDAAHAHHKSPSSSSSFLGLPLASVKMDLPKWTWPAFGRGAKRPPELFAVTPFDENTGGPPASSRKEGARARGEGARERLPLDTPAFERTLSMSGGVEVDRGALEDAMQEERMPMPAGRVPDLGLGAEETPYASAETIKGGDAAAPGPRVRAVDFVGVPPPESMPGPEGDALAREAPPDSADVDVERSLPPTPEPEPEAEKESEREPAEFASTTVHLARAADPQATQRRRLVYLVVRPLLSLSLSLESHTHTLPARAHARTYLPFLIRTRTHVVINLLTRSIDTLPSATKILQPTDRYARSSARLSLRSADFASRAGHLFDARRMLRASDPAISEVFSRGQNPQHWHVARRLDPDTDTDTDTPAERRAKKEKEKEKEKGKEEVYMEVFRKEASLTDVDNALAGVVRKSGVGLGHGVGMGLGAGAGAGAGV